MGNRHIDTENSHKYLLRKREREIEERETERRRREAKPHVYTRGKNRRERKMAAEVRGKKEWACLVP